jgi:hypothetical protein
MFVVKIICVLIWLCFALPLVGAQELKVPLIRPSYGLSAGIGINNTSFINAFEGGVGFMWGRNIYFPTSLKAGFLMLTDGKNFYYGGRGRLSQTLAGLVKFGIIYDFYYDKQANSLLNQLPGPFIGLTLFDVIELNALFNVAKHNKKLISTIYIELVFDAGNLLFLIDNHRLSI